MRRLLPFSCLLLSAPLGSGCIVCQDCTTTKIDETPTWDWVDIETDTDTDADSDSDTDADTDTSLPSDTAVDTVTSTGDTGDVGCLGVEVFPLIDGVHTAVICDGNLLDPATAFTVPTTDPDPGVGQWSVVSNLGWTTTDLGPSPVSWPTLGDLWSMAALTGTLAADGGVLTGECVEIDLVTDATLSYAIDLTVRSTTPVDNLLALFVDDVEVAQYVVVQNEPEEFVGFGYFSGLSTVNIKLCSGFLQGGVNVARVQVREAIITP